MSNDNSPKSINHEHQNPIIEADPYSKPDAKEYYAQEKNIDLPLYDLNANLFEVNDIGARTQIVSLPANQTNIQRVLALSNQDPNSAFGQISAELMVAEGVPIGPVVIAEPGIPIMRPAVTQKRLLTRRFIRLAQLFVCLNTFFFVKT